MNKLKYYGDWDVSRYDLKHMVDHMSDGMQSPMQWRVVTLESDLEDLLEVPILHYDGIKGPAFSMEEKLKIRDYVLRGGVLMAQACKCHEASKEFDEGFRMLMEECFPEAQLEKLPPNHLIYTTPIRVQPAPEIEVIRLRQRIGVIYLPKALSCDWHRGRRSGKLAFDCGANIITYVQKQADRFRKAKAPGR